MDNKRPKTMCDTELAYLNLCREIECVLDWDQPDREIATPRTKAAFYHHQAAEVDKLVTKLQRLIGDNFEEGYELKWARELLARAGFAIDFDGGSQTK